MIRRSLRRSLVSRVPRKHWECGHSGTVFETGAFNRSATSPACGEPSVTPAVESFCVETGSLRA